MEYKDAQLERARIRREKGLGCRKSSSAKAQNKQDRPEKAASGVCLVCGLNRLKCICSGHMSEAAHKRFVAGQKEVLFDLQRA